MQISLAVVGADHPNKDRSNRRFEILLCQPGEDVYLAPEPKNPIDPQAIAVFSKRGVQIGYLRSERAALIGGYLSRGRISGVVFQDRADWGATIRAGLDGEQPTIPALPPEVGHDDGDFYPDYIPPDD